MKLIEIIKELKVEVSKPNIFQAVVAKQYDMNTRFIKATLVDGSDVIYIPSGPTVKAIINANRPDGHSKGFDGVVNDDGTVTVPLHSWMLELEGTVICDISIIDTDADDNKKLTTTAFTLLVERAAYGGSDVTNDPQYDVIISLLETCQEAGVVAQEALDKSNEALANSEEANSKYDACVEATENANAVRKEIEEGGYIESLKELNNGGKFTIWVGSQEEYDSIEEKVPNCLYIVDDDTAPEDIAKALESIDNRLQPLEQDYIVEQKEVPMENITWTCRKWASGIAECWGKTSFIEFDVTEQQGNVYSNGTAWGTVFEYPIEFKSIPTCDITLVGNYSVWFGGGSSAPTDNPDPETRVQIDLLKNTPKLYIYHYERQPRIQVMIHYNVKGRWK